MPGERNGETVRSIRPKIARTPPGEPNIIDMMPPRIRRIKDIRSRADWASIAEKFMALTMSKKEMKVPITGMVTQGRKREIKMITPPIMPSGLISIAETK